MPDRHTEPSAAELQDAEWRDPANWHAGFYYSRRDPRPFVPKRRLAGVTINFARPAGVAFLVGVLLFVALLVVVYGGARR